MIYDNETNILCIELARGKITHAREFGNFIFHMSKSGKPILLEILDASKFIQQFEGVKNLKDLKKMMPAT